MPKKPDERMIGGIALILLGLTFILNNLIGWGAGWPLFIIYGGCMVVVNMIWGDEKDDDAIVGVVTLFVIGGFFLTLTLGFISWSDLTWAWPVFMLAPGIGLIIHYFKSKNGDSLNGGLVLIILASIFLSIRFYDWNLYWPVILIVIGLLIVIIDFLKKR